MVAQFQTRNPVITADLTKFNHVVAALDNVTAGEVETIILSPPTNDKYAALKAGLINAFWKTQASKDMELLSLSGLGDRKPSSLLRHMESLNADPKTLLRALFLAQLPMEVRRVLAAQLSSRLWPRRPTPPWRRAPLGSAPPASLPHLPARHPETCASTTSSLARKPVSAISGGARWLT